MFSGCPNRSLKTQPTKPQQVATCFNFISRILKQKADARHCCLQIHIQGEHKISERLEFRFGLISSLTHIRLASFKSGKP